MEMTRKVSMLNSQVAAQSNSLKDIERAAAKLMAEASRIEANKQANMDEMQRVKTLMDQHKMIMENIADLSKKAGAMEADALTRKNPMPHTAHEPKGFFGRLGLA